jgi:large subunit ribosomal protein L22
MQSQTYIKNVKVTPKKLRMLADVAKKSGPAGAINYLYYTPKKSAQILYKALQSAVANAKHVLKVGDESLAFQSLIIEEGQKLKRFRAGGRGTAAPYARRYSHIKIVLTAKKGAKTIEKPQPVKAEEAAPKAIEASSSASKEVKEKPQVTKKEKK